MDTQSDWSSEDRYQASGQTPPAGAPGQTGPSGLVPPWSVPPGLLNVTRSAAWREAHADALDEADDPGNAADEQAGQPIDEQYAWSAAEQADQPADEQAGRPAHEQADQPAHEHDAWPANEHDAWSPNEQDSWPGVAPPAGWFLHRPGESDPSPEPARDDSAARAIEDAAGEWFSPRDDPDADVSEDGYDEYDEYEDAEDDDPLAAGIRPAALGRDVDAERDRDRGPLGCLRVAERERLEHAEEVLDPVRGPVPGREFAHRHVQRGRDRPADRLIRPGLDLPGAPEPLQGHRPEGIEQHRLADTPEPGEHHAPLRAPPGYPLEHHLELPDLPVAPGEFWRSLPRAWGVRITHRIHGIGLYGLI